MKATAINLDNISKEYIIHHEKPTLIEKFYKGNNEKFFALKNINLEIKMGERLGIIGSNGSGKTTLLKIISGITSPTSGKVTIVGKTASLIDLEAGFHSDLNGEQNIYLQGMILGMKRNEIREKISDIISFADIGRFIDTPLFTYSEGMKLRLGFSVAIHTNPDILILDEGFTAGDSNFQQKAIKKIKEMFLMNKTVLIVSHWLEFVKNNCDRIIVLDKGRVNTHAQLKI